MLRRQICENHNKPITPWCPISVCLLFQFLLQSIVQLKHFTLLPKRSLIFPRVSIQGVCVSVSCQRTKMHECCIFKSGGRITLGLLAPDIVFVVCTRLLIGHRDSEILMIVLTPTTNIFQ